MVTTKSALESISDIPVKIIKVSELQHQQSKSECGLYSLFYIYTRLNGLSYKYFANVIVPDKVMFEFRQHLFADGSQFEWENFQQNNSIGWEY